VISVEWSRRARDLLAPAGADVLYRESPLPHTIDPRFLRELGPWLVGALAASRAQAGETEITPPAS
jgi:predicted esterase